MRIELSHPPLIERRIIDKVEDGTLTVSTHPTTAEVAKSRIELLHPLPIERCIISKVENLTIAVSTHQMTTELARFRNELLHPSLIDRHRETEKRQSRGWNSCSVQ